MSQLTPRQLEAVRHDGHLLIVAGPGSGKTSTSVAKAKRIVRDDARSLLMVTFTKEGAEEMRKRLLAALQQSEIRPPDESRLVVATFHSVVIRHLKRHGMREKVLSPAAQDHLYRDAAYACEVEKEQWGEVQHEFEQVMYSVDRDAVEVSDLTRAVVRRYEQLLQATGQVDLYTTMRNCAIRVDNGSLPPLPFTDLIVDEGQDTDDLQRLWVFAHARAGSNVTIVGDDDQSIYEWRNALGYKGMKSFLDTFKAHRIELGDNFRCRQEILAPAAVLISRNEERLGKELVARRGAGGGACAFDARSSETQNKLLADLIEALPEKHQNTAVLARTNRSLDLLEIVLRTREIEYARAGKSIWDQPSIAGFVGLLQTLLDGSPAGLLPALQLRNIDPQVRSGLLAALHGNVASYLDGEVPDLDSITALDKEKLAELANSFSFWRRQLRSAPGELGGSVRSVILDVGEEYARWNRAEHARKLIGICSKILADLKGSLSSRLRLISQPQRRADAPVLLMTMHAAKGLEFQTVHVIDANKSEDGSTLLKAEPERRLMYVAFTRAKNCLVVWTSGEAHPAVGESAILVCRAWADLKGLVEKTG